MEARPCLSKGGRFAAGEYAMEGTVANQSSPAPVRLTLHFALFGSAGKKRDEGGGGGGGGGLAGHGTPMPIGRRRQSTWGEKETPSGAIALRSKPVGIEGTWRPSTFEPSKQVIPILKKAIRAGCACNASGGQHGGGGGGVGGGPASDRAQAKANR